MRVDITMKRKRNIEIPQIGFPDICDIEAIEEDVMIFKNIDLSHVYYILDLLRVSDKYDKETCHFEIREHREYKGEKHTDDCDCGKCSYTSLEHYEK